MGRLTCELCAGTEFVRETAGFRCHACGCVYTPEQAKRLMQDAKDSGRAIDCTCGRKTRCVVIMDSDHVILSALQNETVSARLNGENARGDEDGGEENE